MDKCETTLAPPLTPINCNDIAFQKLPDYATVTTSSPNSPCLFFDSSLVSDTKNISVPYTTNDAVACQTQPTNISWRPNDPISIQQQCNVKRGRMETSAPPNSTTDYPPSCKARPLCRTEVIKEEVAEKHVKASPVNIKFTSEEDCFLKKGME